MTAAGGRANQRLRTRKDLLEAAARLVKEGRKPSLEEVAEAALVSRATAYRYFASSEALLNEAALDLVAPSPEALFDGDASPDPVARVVRADDALAAMMAENEPTLRLMLISSLQARLNGGDAPARQNRRSALIEAALAPVRKRLKPAAYTVLVRALSLVLGTEALIVFRDVLQIEETEARKVRRWAIRALVEAALKEAAG